VSFLLSGHILERLGGREYSVHEAMSGLKPAGFVHDDKWGEDGVLIFSLKLTGGDLEQEMLAKEPGWSKLEAPRLVSKLVRTCLVSATPAHREEAICDLLALHLRPSEARGAPPPWLARARDAIMDAPSELTVADAALSAGVHRVHFSRLFRRLYGSPPSIYRRHASVARAISQAVLTSVPLSHVALEACFSDQPRLTRSTRAAAGIGPGALRKLLA
jgi:AraC-like DNA-binding protein